MIRRRALVLLPGALVLGLGLAGCGGTSSSPEPVPDARAAVGGYALSTTISASTLDGTTTGPASALTSSLFLSCADVSCSTLDQRALSTGSPQGATVALRPVAGGFHGQHIRTGACGGNVAGSYGESFTWTWEHQPDGTLRGTLVQVFKGCDLDGTTTYEATASPRASAALPYLKTSTARAWVRAVNAYDVELSKVYVSGTECNTVPSTTTVAEAGCFARTYAAWRPDIEHLARATAAVRQRATGPCRDSLAAIRFGTWAVLVRDAATAYDAATDRASVRAGVRAESTATTYATQEHAHLVTALAMCVDPVLAPTLGRNGALGLDQDSVLQPLATG